MTTVKHIAIVVPSGTSLINVAGPLDVFSKAKFHVDTSVNPSEHSYQIHILSSENTKIVHTSDGLPIISEGSYKTVDYPIDTLLIAGMRNAPENMLSQAALDWISQQSTQVRRIGSVCAGAFILAASGVLNGKRATTHWQLCHKLAQLHPEITVEKDPLFIKDGNVYTSAGITTGMDLSLALVEEDYGRDVALFIARQLVLYLKRPGNQSQFSTVITFEKSDYHPIRAAQEWAMLHLKEVCSVEVLAEKAAMSPRNFARVFLRETGITPAKYIEKIRLESARHGLEETQLSLEEIATECGLRSADALRRLFLSHLKTTPSDYRRSFRTSFDV